jgi:hypothetical protein
MRILFLSILALAFSCAGPADNVDDAAVIPLSESLDVIPNKFEISPDSDTLLFGAQGTAIFIPSDAFYLDSSDRDKKITITLKEYYSMSDILMQDLSTESPGGLLETGGMIHIEAAVGDQKKSLQYGKELIVHFPKNGSTADDMQLFSEGSFDKVMGSHNSVVWEEEPRSEGYETDSIVWWYWRKDEVDQEHLYLVDGRHIYNWTGDTIKMTEEERDYVRLRDVNINCVVTKDGYVQNVRFEKDYDEARVQRLMEILKRIPRLKPYTVGGEPIDNDCALRFAVKYVLPKYATNKEYLKTLEKKYPNFEKQSINDLTTVELNYFIFSSAKLGWLNVDRFVDDPAQKVNMTLTLDNPQDLMVKLIYKDYKSVIPADFNNNIYEFYGIPENKKFTLMVIRNEPGKISMSITEHTTKSGPITGVTFKDYTMEELKKELKKLD